jgi:hypothetical protein
MNERILFAGGCHLAGYLVDPVNSFSHIWLSHLQEIGIAVTSDFVTYVPLTRPERIIDRCRSFGPTSVILQVGQYELSREFSSLLPRAKRPPKSRSPRSEPDTPRLQGLSRRSMQWYLRCLSKCALDFVLRHPLVDHRAFEAKMQRLCHALAAERIGRIIMLSPFPAADPVVSRNRRNALQCYRSLAAEYGFVYCDMADLRSDPDDHVFEREAFYADPVHLGIAGHRAVAKRLQESVRELFPGYGRARCEYVSAR